MRKTLVVLLALGLLAGLLAAPGSAAKKKKKAKPVAHTFYLHGTETFGEAEIPDGVGTAIFKPMDETEPSAAEPKSMFVTNYMAGPNTACSGNNLFPTWGGRIAGTVTGDITLYLNAATHPANNLQIDIFADATGGCESSLGSTGFVPPVASQVVSLAPGLGENEIVFEDVKFEAMANITIMVTPSDLGTNPTQARLLYDSTDFASRVEFTCIPASGKSCAQ